MVDDDESVRTSLANLLSTEDYAVEIFASADEYLGRVPRPGPGCLVLDVQLPGIDGLALQRQLTEEGKVEQIVFITGHGDIPMGGSGDETRGGRFFSKTVQGRRTAFCGGVALARSAENLRQRHDWWKAERSLRSSLRENLIRTDADPMPAQADSICILEDDASVRNSIVQLLDTDGLNAESFDDVEALPFP